MSKIKDLDEFAKFISEGRTTVELATYYKCSKSTICNWKTKLGINSTPDTKIDISFEELLTLSTKELKEKYKCSDSSISRRRKDFGIVEKRTIIKDKKCPYCNKFYETWSSVNSHLGYCSDNKYEYYADDKAGLIHYSIFLTCKHQNDLEVKYPELSHISWLTIRNHFKKLNITDWPSKEWSNQLIIERLQEFIDNHGRPPLATDLQKLKYYPNYNTIKKRFGSLITALQILIPDYHSFSNLYGIPTKALDGVTYPSNFEAKFVNNKLFNKFQYKYEVPYEGYPYLYDFYIPEKDIYIELAGLMNQETYINKMNHKIQINKEQNKKLIIVTPKTLDSITIE